MAEAGRIICLSTLRAYKRGSSGGGASTIPPKGRNLKTAAKMRIKASAIRLTPPLALSVVKPLLISRTIRMPTKDFETDPRDLAILRGPARGAGVRAEVLMEERLVVVELAGEQLLIGVSPGGLQTLHRLDQPLDSRSTGESAGGFAERLKAFRGGSTG